MRWKEINKNYKFKGDSIVIQKHQTHLYDCYEVEYNAKKIVLSKDHIIQVNIANFPHEAQAEIKALCKGKIPLTEDIHAEVLAYVNETEKEQINKWLLGENINIQVDDLSENTIECYVFNFPNRKFGVEVIVKRIPLTWENQKIDEHNYWVPIEGIAYLFNKYGKLDMSGIQITNLKYQGKLPCFCVSTDTGHYELNGLKHHNSVMVSNILLHCLEHWDKISLLLVDPKIVEFSNYKDMKGVVAVANTLQEAVECLRLSKTVMYKRNKDLEELGLKQIKEYTPHDKSGKVFVTGREYLENDMIKAKIDDEEKSVSAANLVDIVREPHNKVEVNLNGETWLEVNEHCVDYIYNDELKMLIIIIDEVAELTEASKGKDALSKEEDAIRSEILAIMKSIAQLGRNAGIHMLVCTQKPTVDILPGTLRSNLGFRAYCGKATEAGPSIVTLNNTLALNTPKEPRGRAIVQSGTLGEFLQVYFSEFKDLEKYYSDRGLDNKGYTPGMTEVEIQTEELSGTEEILDKPEEMNAEFYGEKIHIDRRENQIFEEL